MSSHQHLVVAANRIGGIAEGARRAAVGIHDDVPAGEHFAHEIRHHALVGDLQSRAVVVERAGHLRRDAVLLGKDYAERLAETLGLVVAGPRPGTCLLYTSDAADERSSVDLGG